MNTFRMNYTVNNGAHIKRFLLPIFSSILCLLFLSSCVVKQLPNADIKPVSVVEKPVEEKTEELWVAKPPLYNPTRSKKFELIHTRLKLKPVWEVAQVEGEAVITVKPHHYDQNELELDAKAMIIHSLTVKDAKGITSPKYDYDTKSIKIKLNKTYTPLDTIQVKISYTARPNEVTKEQSADKGLYFIDPKDLDPDKPQQIWTQGEPENNSCWFPSLDVPNQKMSQEIYLTVDKKYTTLSNGALIYSKNNPDGTRTDYWRQDKKHSVYLAMIAVGEFAVVKDTWRDSIEVNYYVEKEYEKYAKMVFGNTPEMMTFFSELLKMDYPWEKYSQIVVQDYVSGAMENTGAVIYNSSFQHDYRSHLDYTGEATIAHELFHHWFGNIVTAESWSQLALNESFADYSEYLWEEYKNGKDAADFTQQHGLETYFVESENKKVPIIRYDYSSPDAMFDIHTYEKGGRVLHMLRSYVGDKAFFESLHLYLKKFEYGSAEIHDLRLVFEEVTGEDLNWFFNQWFLSPGHPELEVKHHFGAKELTVEVRQVQETRFMPLFRIPLKLDYWIKGKKYTEPILIDKAIHTFRIPVPQQAEAFLLDGQQQLMGMIHNPKSIEEWLRIYELCDLYQAKYDALIFTADSSENPGVIEMNKKALSHKFWDIRKTAVHNFEYFDGQEKAGVLSALSGLAQKDSVAKVRTAATYALATFVDSTLSDLFLNGLNDSAYSVVSASLNALAKLKTPGLSKRIEGFRNSEYPGIIVFLAKLYISENDTTQYDWFTQKLKTQRRNSYYMLLQQYIEYMTMLPRGRQLVAVDYYRRIIEGNNRFWIKLSAYKGLMSLTDLPEAKVAFDALKAQEKDTQFDVYFRIMEEVSSSGSGSDEEE